MAQMDAGSPEVPETGDASESVVVELDDDEELVEEKKRPWYAPGEGRELTAGSMAELVGFGLGVPMPASVELDTEAKVLRMEFECNNKGRDYAYMEEGYVDESADVMGQMGRWFGGLMGRKDAKAEPEAAAPEQEQD